MSKRDIPAADWEGADEIEQNLQDEIKTNMEPQEPKIEDRESLLSEIRINFNDIDAMVAELKGIDLDSLNMDTLERITQKLKDLRVSMAANSMELQKLTKE